MKTYKINIFKHETRKGDNLKRKLKSRWQKIKNKTQNKRNRKKTILEKTNEACLLFPNFKPASNQTKIQKFFEIIFIIKHIRKTRFFLKKKIENK